MEQGCSNEFFWVWSLLLSFMFSSPTNSHEFQAFDLEDPWKLQICIYEGYCFAKFGISFYLLKWQSSAYCRTRVFRLMFQCLKCLTLNCFVGFWCHVFVIPTSHLCPIIKMVSALSLLTLHFKIACCHCHLLRAWSVDFIMSQKHNKVSIIHEKIFT